MSELQAVALVLVGLAGTGVVLTRSPARQALMAGVLGVLLAILFFLFQAPDVGLSQLTVGTVALPLMILLALSKIREHER